MALVLFMVEMLIPPLPFNAKIGLANIAAMLALIMLGFPEAFAVVVVKSVLSGLFSGLIMGFAYSIAGGISSLVVMALIYRFLFPRVGVIGISVAGAVVHVFAQVMVGVAIIRQINLITLLPYLVLISVGAGVFVGAVVLFMVKYLPLKVVTQYLK
ncbi:MAG: Gx transporter family protein [Firmicutes bacterium]|nr:Gx transporter family protein [Bacillota bacterium]